MNNKQSKDSIPFKVPVSGSLGILALGAVGVQAWRKVKNENKRVEKD